MKMKRKGRSTNKNNPILDQNEHLHVATTYLGETLSASIANDQTLSIINNIANDRTSFTTTNATNQGRTSFTATQDRTSSTINNSNRLSFTTTNQDQTSFTSTNSNNIRTSSTINNTNNRDRTSFATATNQDRTPSTINSDNYHALTCINNTSVSWNSDDPTSPTIDDNRTLSSLDKNSQIPVTNDDTSSASLSIINNSVSLPVSNNNHRSRPPNKNNPNGRKISSNVWLYAMKSDDNKQAVCRLCGFTCTTSSHSTSSIRHHLIRQHDKYDLIINSSPSKNASISERFKRELHDLCYNAIVMDHRPFNDLRKKGIMTVFNRLCPGMIDF